jgi:large conductance mechanosensitive channel
MTMLRGFKAFLLRGNVVDLAVAVVIGAAFSLVINAFVKDLITPLIAALFGQPSFGNLYFTINNSKFLYGDFLNALIAFFIAAAVIYYFVVVPINALIERSHRHDKPADPTTKKCPECLSEIPIEAKRCAFCAQPVPV